MKYTRFFLFSAFLLMICSAGWSQTGDKQGIAPQSTEPAKPKVDTVYVPELVLPATTKQEAAAEAAQRVVQKAAAQAGGPRIYGHSLFTDQTLDVFRTTDGSQAPDTYVLGAGDEVRITIFGASQTDMQLRINSEGYIQPAGSPKLFLQGLTLAEARTMIANRLAYSYSFGAGQISIIVATARTVLVNVFGETRITGGFNISALNSALNAISAAGGLTSIGSVRDIQLIRGKQKKSIDLYLFMTNPSYQFQFDLLQNDIIFVPVAQKLVTIEGAVKRPMIYEMKGDETLPDLIRYAGGVNVDVYPDFVQIQRFTGEEIGLLEYNLATVIDGKERVELKNGDVVRVRSLNKPIEQFTEIKGSVYYPGRYDLVKSPTLGSLLRGAQPKKEARTDLVFVDRYRPDETVEVMTIAWAKLQERGEDFTLQPRDRVTVPEKATYRDVGTIAVSGDVRNPFEKTLALGDRLTVQQALDLAGGLKSSAYPVAYIFRRNLLNPVEMEYLRIDLDKAPEILLQPGDRLNVYDNTLYTNIGEVRVFGAVKKPHGLIWNNALTFKDLLATAGGLTVGAALDRVEVFRTVLSPTQAARLEMVKLTIDTAFNVLTPSGFTLQPYDQVVVRMTPEFTLGRVVELSGEVKYPGIYVLESKQVRLSEVIEKAGGLLASADPEGSRLFRTYNKVGNIIMNVKKSVSNQGNLKYDPFLFEGDVINVNRLENTVTIRLTGTRMSEYPGQTENVINLVYQGSKSAKWYINRYAGGFVRTADKSSVTVIKRNGQMTGTRRSFLWIRKYPKVAPGVMILVKERTKS